MKKSLSKFLSFIALLAMLMSASPVSAYIYNPTTFGSGGITPSQISLTNTHIIVGDASNLGADVALTLSATPGTFSLANTGVLTMPNATTTLRGLLSSADWNTFNNKLTSTLTSAHLFIGNGSNIATDTALSGDATLANTGALTLATVNSNVGSFTNASITVNGKGLITAASNGAAPEVPLTFSTGLTRIVNTITANISTGISGGQTAIGGTAAGENLTLSSTSNGTKGKILFGTSGYDEVNNRLGINNTTPLTGIELMEDSTAAVRGFLSGQYSDTINSSRLILRKARGTRASPTTVVTGDNLSTLVAEGYDGTNYLQDGQILFGTQGTIASTRIPTYFTVSTATDAAPSVLTEGMRIQANGTAGFGLSTKLNALTAQSRADSVLTGTTTVSASTTVTGSGTLFLSELGIGDRISVSSAAATFVYVTAIASNTSLTVSANLGNGTSQTINKKEALLGVNNSAGTRQWTIDDTGQLISSNSFTNVFNNNTAFITTSGIATFQSMSTSGYRLVNLVNGDLGNSSINGMNDNSSNAGSINIQNSATTPYTLRTAINTTANPNMVFNARPNSTESLFSFQKSGTEQIGIGNTGLITKYGGIATAGNGVVAVQGYGRTTAQTAANASFETYTVGASDESLDVSANVNVTASVTNSFTVTCTYTDETNTSRTLTLTFSNVGGTFLTTITNVTGTGAYEGIPLHIRAKSGTTITMATVGTFTSVTYNAEGAITKLD